MTAFQKTISVERMQYDAEKQKYIFGLIAELSNHGMGQSFLYVNVLPGLLEIQPKHLKRQNSECELDALVDLSTPEKAIESVVLFHPDFLSCHGITMDVHPTWVESIALPQGME